MPTRLPTGRSSTPQRRGLMSTVWVHVKGCRYAMHRVRASRPVLALASLQSAMLGRLLVVTSSLSLSLFHVLPTPQEAVETLVATLGMQPCEGTEAVPPNARSHTVLMAGLFVGHQQVSRVCHLHILTDVWHLCQTQHAGSDT
jgi:hypothetical protein